MKKNYATACVTIVPRQVVISKSTDELVVTAKNRKNKHRVFDAAIRRWVMELNEDNFRVVAFSTTVLPDEKPKSPYKSTFAVTFICEDISLQERSRVP